MKYATELIARIGEHFGVDMGEFRSKSQATNEGVIKAANKTIQPTAYSGG
jgi:hypothetical protein